MHTNAHQLSHTEFIGVYSRSFVVQEICGHLRNLWIKDFQATNGGDEHTW